jgi:hypothetical protein
MFFSSLRIMVGVFALNEQLLLKNAVFWDVVLCRACVNRRFGGTYRLHLQCRTIRERGTSVSWWPHALHSATSQKTAFFIVTAVKTSNLTIVIIV